MRSAWSGVPVRSAWAKGRESVWLCQDCRCRFSTTKAAWAHAGRLGHYVAREGKKS